MNNATTRLLAHASFWLAALVIVIMGWTLYAASTDEAQLVQRIAVTVLGLVVLIPAYLGFVLQSRSRQHAEQRLRQMVGSFPGAIYQLSHTARGSHMVLMSAAVSRISRKTNPDWSALLDDIDDQDRAAFVARVAKSKQAIVPFCEAYRVRHADGSTQLLRHEASLNKQPDGSILQNGSIVDISEQQRLEQALATTQHALAAANEVTDQADRSKKTFLATMGHEIRTPMNEALGMLEVLSLSKLDDEQRATLAIVHDSGTSLMRLFDDILDFSMIEADTLKIRPEVISIATLIEGVREIYSGIASSKGLPILRSIDPRISKAVRVEPLRLRQILNNLVSNALKFTTHGHVEIKAQWMAHQNGEDRIQFVVSDTGVGISPDDQRRLFKPFRKGEGAVRREVSGTGLGLTICRQLARLMGGTVEMLSEPGVGTIMTLTLSLPVADSAELPVVKPTHAFERLAGNVSCRRKAPTIEQAVREGTLVLIVDDHPTNRMLLSRQVQILGYAVVTASNGVEALKFWQGKPLGLIITDCNMPEMDGYELVRIIRGIESRRSSARVRILACTANAVVGQADECLNSGMDDCLVKPVDLAQMAAKLDQWLPLSLPDTPRPSEVPVPRALTRRDLDRGILAEMSDGDADVERGILHAFREANDGDAAVLERAVMDQDSGGVLRYAHRISGASKMIGALSLAGVCGRIEHAGRSGDWTSIVAEMPALQRECQRLNTYLDRSC